MNKILHDKMIELVESILQSEDRFLDQYRKSLLSFNPIFQAVFDLDKAIHDYDNANKGLEIEQEGKTEIEIKNVYKFVEAFNFLSDHFKKEVEQIHSQVKDWNGLRAVKESDLN